MSSHLSTSELQELEQNLIMRSRTLKDEIHQQLSNSGIKIYVELADKVHDSGEDSTAELLADINYHVIEKEIQELRAVEQALEYMHNKQYGICVDCEAPISIDRLRAFPTATRCISCQQTFEDNQ